MVGPKCSAAPVANAKLCRKVDSSSDIDAFLRFLFSHAVLVFRSPSTAVHPLIVACKGCLQNIPAPVKTMPDSWIVAECPLCGTKRQYLPTEIFMGRISHELLMKSGSR